MEDQSDVRRQRIQDEWGDLEREEAELLSAIAEDRAAIEKKTERLLGLQDYMVIFKAFNFGPPEESEPQFNFEPAGPCPLAMEQLQEADGYQSALATLGKVLPGRYIHGRTAAQWLIDAGILEGLSIDEARMRVNKFMARSWEWETVEGHRGWFRYLPQFGHEDAEAPAAEAELAGSAESEQSDTGTNQENQQFDDGVPLRAPK